MLSDVKRQMNVQQENAVLTFDPGATTGVALFSAPGEVIFTCALESNALFFFVTMLNKEVKIDVVIEVGPQLTHSNPLTKRVEVLLCSVFPDAHLVQPSQWKRHPASRVPAGQYRTIHEHDAVSIGKWYRVIRRDNAKTSGPDDSARTDTKRPGH